MFIILKQKSLVSAFDKFEYNLQITNYL